MSGANARRGRGRPSLGDDARTVVFSVRITGDDRRLFDEAAGADERVGEWAYRALLAAARRDADAPKVNGESLPADPERTSGAGQVAVAMESKKRRRVPSK